MAPHELRRPFKRPAISDQQKRRDLSLLRQAQNRQDAQRQARCLASTVLSFSEPNSDPEPSVEPEPEPEPEEQASDLDVRYAAKLRGAEARRWFATQLMLPEWMIDVPDRLNHDWYVFARPAGKRCFVVSSNGTTVSRLRNGSLLHRFPSALPSGARTKGNPCSAQSYCILDCIFNELDQTYYVIDMVCWAGYSLYECTAEFRYFWLNSKLVESGACDPPSFYHKYRFGLVPVYNCDQAGLHIAYSGPVPFVKDGLLFYNKNAHYQTGNTPLALVWKDENCSQYVIDTDSKGQVPHQQQVVLELRDDGKLITSDDPHVVFGCLDTDFMQKSGLQSKYLLRFAVSDGGLTFVEGKLERADLQYLGKANRARAFADSYSKVMFQYMARHSPLRIEDLLASISSSNDQDNGTCGMEEMVDG
ncbi:Snurportin-1 like [Actinidia chinensis var. chinensis]|uniref:Snurportin-1 n=1 Tax=Actinidia chinensis var. chinensis TaxID=1590841 RepID=A0A2R6QGC1_ACTCC|nr:Snurportin-1 like [Actinidia chinensis var. chinensis]